MDGASMVVHLLLLKVSMDYSIYVECQTRLCQLPKSKEFFKQQSLFQPWSYIVEGDEG